jgi:hypothetical protein
VLDILQNFDRVKENPAKPKVWFWRLVEIINKIKEIQFRFILFKGVIGEPFG